MIFSNNKAPLKTKTQLVHHCTVYKSSITLQSLQRVPKSRANLNLLSRNPKLQTNPNQLIHSNSYKNFLNNSNARIGCVAGTCDECKHKQKQTIATTMPLSLHKCIKKTNSNKWCLFLTYHVSCTSNSLKMHCSVSVILYKSCVKSCQLIVYVP